MEKAPTEKKRRAGELEGGTGEWPITLYKRIERKGKDAYGTIEGGETSEQAPSAKERFDSKCRS